MNIRRGDRTSPRRRTAQIASVAASLAHSPAPLNIVTADLNHEWIISDIGGTHARFNRWSTQSGLSDNPPARYRNDDFRDLAALINQYRGDAAPRVVQAMLALALPVGPGEMRMTNRSWAFTEAGAARGSG